MTTSEESAQAPQSVRDVPLGRLHQPPPGAGASLPGLVLIHDVWGLSEHSRGLASDLAAEGFVVLEIDLYRERGDVAIEDPAAFIRALPDPAVLADLDAGADWLAAQERCRGRGIGVVGVCMGGSYALLAACRSDRFTAAAPFYGILSYDHGMLADPRGRDRERKPASPLEAAEALRMPLHASFGQEDAMVPLADVDRLEAALARSGRPWEVHRYAGAGHAFLNRTREAAYRGEASRQAWERVIPFLRKTLG